MVTYIENQEEHHKKQNFEEEHVTFLKAFGIEYDDGYILKAVNEDERESSTG